MAFKRCKKVRYVDSVLEENEKDATHRSCAAAKILREDVSWQENGETEGRSRAWCWCSSATHALDQTNWPWCLVRSDRRNAIDQTNLPRCLVRTDRAHCQLEADARLRQSRARTDGTLIAATIYARLFDCDDSEKNLPRRRSSIRSDYEHAKQLESLLSARGEKGTKKNWCDPRHVGRNRCKLSTSELCTWD
jgi:hypothetical protein